MGGGDLNMKKSWHPLLMKNQERVWKEERKALEERKKTMQLQKELAEERQLQELQKLHAAQRGLVREERVEWLYATPATGNGINTEEQEAYLLGKKTVDKLFKEKDEAAAKLAAKATTSADIDKPGGGFISLQNANTIRDTANKIREDPLLAIKQQEHLAYEALKKNPSRLKALQSQINSKHDRKRQKQERRQEREQRKELTNPRSSSEQSGTKHSDIRKRPRYGHHSHGMKGDHPSSEYNRDQRRSPFDRVNHPKSPARSESSRSLSPGRSSDRRRTEKRHHRVSPAGGRYHEEYHRPSHSPPSESHLKSRYHRSSHPVNAPSYSRGEWQPRRSPSPNPSYEKCSTIEKRSYPTHLSERAATTSRHHTLHPTFCSASEERQNNNYRIDGSRGELSNANAAKLAQMKAAAKSLEESRSQRLKLMEAQDLKQLRAEEAERDKNRIKSSGVEGGTRAKFIREQETKVYFGDMGLAERVQRSGGVGLVKQPE